MHDDIAVDCDLSSGVCPRCKQPGQPHWRRNCPETKSRGLGDTIAKVTTALGIPPCGGCKERQEKLNKLVPYKTT